jgi:WhiB family transcriptional regulator, redox-sensing transcriptional regulator
MTPEGLALIAAIIADTPALPGALCPDWPATFAATADASDPDTHTYAVATALRLCRCCPALTRCRNWFNNLPPNQRPPGITAGLTNGKEPAMTDQDANDDQHDPELEELVQIAQALNAEQRRCEEMLERDPIRAIWFDFEPPPGEGGGAA